MKVALIAALARNGAIGRDNQMPWHLPNDLKRFRQITLNKPVIMGRHTFESIGKPLPQRRNIVVTTTPERLAHHDVEAVPNLTTALKLATDAAEVMVIGGAQIYRQALPHADLLYLTRIDSDIEGDTYFPEIHAEDWRPLSIETQPADEKHAWPCTFEVLQRVT